MEFDAGAGEDLFVKVKGLITRLIDRLQIEMSHVSYCDEETSMAAEKEDLEDDTAKHSSPLETAVPNSTESVNEGHPGKFCDQFSDAVLNACLTCDTKCKVANETCVKDNMFMVAGEITVAGKHETVVRGVIPRQTDQVIDVPVVLVVQVPWVRVVAETAEIPQLLFVKKIGVIPETAEIPQSLSDGRGAVQNIGIDSFIDDLSSVGSTQQQHNNHHRKQRQHSRADRRGKKRREGSRRKGERKKEGGGRGQEGKRKEKEREAEVKKDVTDWTVVTRNRRQRKMVQIFVKVNGSKATTMEVNLTDDKIEGVLRRIQKDEDVYVTMHGRVLKRSERLKSFEVTDGCTIQVTDRLRGGGKHKDKRSRAETRRGMDTSGQKDQQVGLSVDKCQEMTQAQKDVVVQPLEADETYQRMITMILVRGRTRGTRDTTFRKTSGKVRG